jgi:hypothetical protein
MASQDHLLGNAALVIMEEKAELDSSGDSSAQAGLSYLHHWADPRQKARSFDSVPMAMTLTGI